VVFEAEASGGSKAGGLLHPSLSLPSPFPLPLSFQTNQWEGRSDPVSGSSPAPPPTNTTLIIDLFYDYDTTISTGFCVSVGLQ